MRNLLPILAGARLHLGLSRGGLSLVHRPDGWRRKATKLLDLPGDVAGDVSSADLPARLAPALGGGRFAGLPLAVALGDECVRLFMVPPPRNAVSLQDVRAAAAMRFNTLYGDDPAAWKIECAVASDRPFLACAIPAVLASSVQAAARDHRLRLVSLAPTFVLAWNRLYRRLGTAWLGVVQGGHITLGCTSGGDLIAVHRAPLAGARLRELVRTVALRYGLDEPSELKLFGGTVPGLVPPATIDGLTITRIDPPRRRRFGGDLFLPLIGERPSTG